MDSRITIDSLVQKYGDLYKVGEQYLDRLLSIEEAECVELYLNKSFLWTVAVNELNKTLRMFSDTLTAPKEFARGRLLAVAEELGPMPDGDPADKTYRNARAVELAMESAVKLKPDCPYVMFVNNGALTAQEQDALLNWCVRWKIQLAIVKTRGLPFPNQVGMYKLEKPNGA